MLGNAYEYLIKHFADLTNKKAVKNINKVTTSEKIEILEKKKKTPEKKKK